MNLNEKTIQEIAQRNPTAEAFFTYAACRERNVRDGVSHLRAIRAQMEKEGFHPVPQDLLSTFRELDRAGIGKLNGDQFKWNVPIKQVGAIASDNKPSIVIKTPGVPKVTEVKERDLEICLGPDKWVSMTYTTNLTEEDAKFIYARLLEKATK